MSEPILEPDLPIIDPHHHLWDRPTAILKNLPPSDHGFMDIIRDIPRYLLDELLADLTGGHKVIGTVYMECGAMYRADGPEALRCVGETEFVNGIAAMTASGIYGDLRACAGMKPSFDQSALADEEVVLLEQGDQTRDRVEDAEQRHHGGREHDPTAPRIALRGRAARTSVVRGRACRHGVSPRGCDWPP